MPSPWSREEVEATVADYLHMLTQELAGQSYNKTKHRQALSAKLNDRNDGAIERKHQNISAVLIDLLGVPSIIGYKPLRNYQGLLAEVVAEQLRSHELLNRVAATAVELPASPPLLDDFRSILVDPPARAKEARSPDPTSYIRERKPIRLDYLDREARNRSLGLAGEKFALAYEHARLYAVGQKRLADRIEHVSQSKGDGLGYDISSFEESGEPRFIEVKTTAFVKETPFYISKGEVDFSKERGDQFHLYRLFAFRQDPKLFDLRGPVASNCFLDPISFVGRFAA